MSGYKVRVSGPGGTIVFEASSPMAETRSAAYDGFNIIHMPTSLLAYRNTSGRKFSLTGKLVSRTAEEATSNAGYIDLARKWLLPDFGTTGATPPILRLFAYRHNNIDNRQVVLQSYSWNFPDDVDYIWQAGQAMPIIGQLGLELEEVYSASQITGGAWRLSASGGGGFAGGAGSGGPSSAFWMDFGNARTTENPLAIANITTPSIPLVSGIATILDKAVTNPDIAATILVTTFNSAMSLSSSGNVTEETRQLPTTRNPFVSGPGAYPFSSVPSASPLPSSTATADPFARTDGLAPPTIIGP